MARAQFILLYAGMAARTFTNDSAVNILSYITIQALGVVWWWMMWRDHKMQKT